MRDLNGFFSHRKPRRARRLIALEKKKPLCRGAVAPMCNPIPVDNSLGNLGKPSAPAPAGIEMKMEMGINYAFKA